MGIYWYELCSRQVDDENDEENDDENDDGKSGGCEGWLGAAIDSQDGVMCHGRAASTKFTSPLF